MDMSSILRFSRFSTRFLALYSAIAILGGGCQMVAPLINAPESSSDTNAQPTAVNGEPDTSAEVSSTAQPEDETIAASTDSSPPANAAPATATAPPTPAVDPFPNAINQASAAFTLSQSAQSQDDWRLVANRWQQAIETMTTVPAASPNHGAAQQKLTDYRRNLTYARQQAAMPLPERAPGRIIEVPVASSSPPPITPQPSQPTPAPTPSSSGGRVYSAPIVSRSGGTPVVLVTFNGSQPFEMIVDTGASGTVITQSVAIALGVRPVGETSVATASSNNVTFQLGYVDSMEVGGSRQGRTLVAIAGPSLDIGLLGHDFFGRYDVTVRQDVVEFRER
ncbi:MAG: retropepsin-like aspartic protease [Elainellaceae cyanobacterium]